MTVSNLRRAGRALSDNGLWLTALLAVAAFGGLVLVGDGRAVAAAVGRVEPWRFAVVLGLATAGYAVRFLKWEYYLRELDVDVPTGTSLLVFASGLMMVVTPGKAGEVWKAWFLRDLRGVPVRTTAPVVGAERVTDLLALAAFAGLGLVRYDRSSLALVAVTAAFVVGLGVLQWRSLCLAVLARLGEVPVVGRYAEDLEAFYERSYALLRPRPLAVALAVSLLAWGLEGVALWVVLDGFAGEGTLLLALFVFGLASVVGAASLLPGGLVAAEASMLGLLVALGYSQAAAAGATLAIRAGTLWYGVVLGAATFAAYRLARRPE